MKKKDFTPMIMWFCLLAGIIGIAFIRSGRPSIWRVNPVNFDIVFIASYILWMLAEFRVTRKDVDTGGKNRADSATCQLYGSGQALTFLTALWFPSVWRSPNPAHFIGIGVFLCGVFYRLWAIRTLTHFYSHRIQTVTGHRIVASGP